MIAIVWDGDGKDARMIEKEIPADLRQGGRTAMIEAAVEMDDTAMEAYLEGKAPS